MNVRRVATGHDAHGKALIVVEPAVVAVAMVGLPRTT